MDVTQGEQPQAQEPSPQVEDAGTGGNTSNTGTGSEAPEASTAQPQAPMSRSQQKKLAKQQRYLETKAERKAAEKARKKEQKQEKKRQRDEEFKNMTEEERQAAIQRNTEGRKNRRLENQQKAEKMKGSLAEGNTCVAIDLDFESYMVESDQRHLCQQLSYSYSCNTKVERPVHLQLVGLRDGFAALFDKQLPSATHWHVTRTDKPWTEHFKDQLDKVVYLTADSPNELTDLESDKTYIIGGIVDHNKHKGLCYKRATAAGVATARLPISKYVKLESSAVLTVNHVVQLLVEYVNRRDWRAVLEDVLPKRKRAGYQQNKSALSSGGGSETGVTTEAGEDGTEPTEAGEGGAAPGSAGGDQSGAAGAEEEAGRAAKVARTE